MKLFIDCETTGLRAGYNDLLTVGIVNSDYNIELVYRMRPLNESTIEEKALEVNGLSKEEIMTWGWPSEVKNKFLLDLQIIARKYTVPKFTPVGQNYQFDLGFLSSWLGKDYGKIFDRRYLDTMIIAHFVMDKNLLIHGLSLKDLCEYYGVINECAHNELGDAYATEALYKKLLEVN